MEIVPRRYHGLKLCLGCFSQIGEDIPVLIRRFGERDQIVFVHFQDVVGTVSRFHETFVDEGNYDEYDAMQALADFGFDGAVFPTTFLRWKTTPSGATAATRILRDISVD